MTTTQTFWEHLDELRRSLIKIAIAVVVMAVVAFCFKEPLFFVVFAPKNADFITYQCLEKISNELNIPFTTTEHFKVQLINTALAEQFLMHMKMAFLAGVVLTSPYILFLLFRFIAPALYNNEKKYATTAVIAGYVMFLLGLLVNYFIIFPLTFRFLGTYQVSSEVENLISLQSYIGTLIFLSLAMGIIFEIPILSWVLAKMDILSAKAMIKYRRHAIVVILLIGAVITPTTDVFTLSLVVLPMYLLYEASILVVKKVNKKRGKNG